MIEFRNVTLRYHYEAYNLFENLSFCLTEGENTVLCDMQSGKSSLCKMLLSQLPPNAGSVLVDGVDLYNFEKGKQRLVNALYLPSAPTFFENKTVRYNLEYPLRVRKQLAQNASKVALLAEKFGLQSLLSQKVKKLNFRQKKILSLVRGLTVERDIVLFDGFFDDTESDGILSRDSVMSAFSCKTKVIFTTDALLAIGNTVVIDNKKCAFSGASDDAAAFVANLTWLSRRISETL